MSMDIVERLQAQLKQSQDELEAVKAERDGWYRDYQSEFKERIEQLQLATDKGFNEGISEALISLGYATDMEELKCRIEAKMRKEVTE